jgi:hypothetical protein
MSLVLARHLMCKEVVELVTSYAEGALDAEDRARFEEHLVTCGPCVLYYDQIHTAIQATRASGKDAISPDEEQALLRVFHAFQRGGG